MYITIETFRSTFIANQITSLRGHVWGFQRTFSTTRGRFSGKRFTWRFFSLKYMFVSRIDIKIMCGKYFFKKLSCNFVGKDKCGALCWRLKNNTTHVCKINMATASCESMPLQHLAPLGRLSGVCVLQNSFFYSYCCLTLIIFVASHRSNGPRI